MSNDEVIEIRKVDKRDPIEVFKEIMLDSLDKFPRTYSDGHKAIAPTAILFIIFDDQGAFKIAWDMSLSKLPPTALVGIATRAIVGTKLEDE